MKISHLLKVKNRTRQAVQVVEKPKRQRSFECNLINSRAVKLMALELSDSTRAGRFKRVSKEFLVRCNSALAAFIRSEIHRHPSVGKTIK